MVTTCHRSTLSGELSSHRTWAAPSPWKGLRGLSGAFRAERKFRPGALRLLRASSSAEIAGRRVRSVWKGAF